MGNLNTQTWDELWNSLEAEKVRKKVLCCDRDCWMIGSVSPAMHKYIWKPTTWVLVHKFKALFSKHPYSMYELKICRDYRDGKVTKEQLDKCSTCDFNAVVNSGYRFDIDEIVELAKKYGKNFEFLQQPLNINQIDLIKEKGKSYGEASLIDFAFKNSILIKKYEEVYKITGRIFLKNSETILRKQKKGNSEFICKNKIGWMNTEFFKVTKSDYFNVFSNALELVDDYEKKCIEKVYYKLSVNAKLKVTCFRSYPLLTGRVASERNRRYDKNGIKLFACRVFTYLHIYDLKY